jgi:hypothetical protein
MVMVFAACGLMARGQSYEAAATINQFTGSPAAGLAAGSQVELQLNLGGSYSYEQLNGSDSIISLPAATFAYNSVNGGSTSSGSIQGVTVFFADNFLGLGETVFEAQAANGSGLFAVGFSKPAGAVTDNTMGSLVSFLGSDLAADINSSLQLSVTDTLGPAGVEADPLTSFKNLVAVPEPSRLGILSGAGLLGVVGFTAGRRKLKLSPVASR